MSASKSCVFGSLDPLDDAVAMLSDSPFQYLLITWVSPDRTQIDSHINKENWAKVRGWIEDGSITEMIDAHFAQNAED